MIKPQPLSAEDVLAPGDYRGALAAVLEALDIPHAATVGDEEIRDAILLERVGHTVRAIIHGSAVSHRAPRGLS